MMNAREYPLVETPDVLLAALERANDAVVIIDGDLCVSHFNAAAELIWGLDRAEVLGRHVSGLGLSDLPQPGDNDTDQVRKSEITIEHKDGSRHRAALSLCSVEAGGQTRTIAFARDITREVVRRERMAVLELVADKTNRAVVVTDRNLKIVYTNAAFTRDVRLFGRGSKGPAGQRAYRGPAYRPQDAGKIAALDRCRSRRRGGNPRL